MKILTQNLFFPIPTDFLRSFVGRKEFWCHNRVSEPVAKKLVNKAKRQQLLQGIKAKPFEQSAPASESGLGTSTTIITAKESPQFRPNRALDDHFRFCVADAKPLGTIAPNLMYSSPRTLPTSCQKLNSIV